VIEPPQNAPVSNSDSDSDYDYAFDYEDDDETEDEREGSLPDDVSDEGQAPQIQGNAFAQITAKTQAS
jgi:hypothetical protein